MKTLFLIVAMVVMTGCGAATYNTIPAGKTVSDWGHDEQYCLDKAHRFTGFWITTPLVLWNIAEGDKRNEACLRELGWIK